MTKQELATEAFSRATQGQSVVNYASIYEGFAEKGIAEAEIVPRVNVLTYHAWRAVGRQVRKGEHGVKVFTFITMSKEVDGEVETFKRPKSTTVFHITQTDET
jgi:hypothetical protein